MTNPGGESSETPASDPSSGSSEPTPGGYEAPSIEQSQQHDEQPEPQPGTEQFIPPAAPADQYFPPSAPTEQYTPPGYAPPSTGYDVPPSYQPPADYQQGGYPPPGYAPAPAYPPPGYPTPESQQQSYPPPYPDPSAFGGQPGYGTPAYPPPPPYGAAPGYPPPPPTYGAPGYPGGYGAGYGQSQPETNQMAVWSLVASLVGFLCWISGPIGIALGFVALNQIKQRGQGGHGLAVAGIAVGAASLIIGLIWFIFALSG